MKIDNPEFLGLIGGLLIFLIIMAVAYPSTEFSEFEKRLNRLERDNEVIVKEVEREIGGLKKRVDMHSEIERWRGIICLKPFTAM